MVCFPTTLIFATCAGLVENNESSKKALGEALDVMQLTGPSAAGDESPRKDKKEKKEKKELTEDELEKKRLKMEAPNMFIVSVVLTLNVCSMTQMFIIYLYIKSNIYTWLGGCQKEEGS